MSVATPLDLSKARLSPSAVAGLGSITKSKATLVAEARRSVIEDRFRLQEAAKDALPHERVARCCRWLRAGERAVEVLHSPTEGRAHYARLERCGSVWQCPVCAAKVAEVRRDELRQGVEAAVAGGGAVLHLTYTVRHQRGDQLAALLGAFSTAYSRMVGHRTYRKLISKTYAIMGAVRAQEVTHGENGWHPHYHVLLFLSRPLSQSQLAALETEIRALWASSAGRQGLDMNRAGFALRASSLAASGYVAKWGVEEEMAKSHLKTGRNGSRSPWGLLRASADGDVRAGYLWREYATVFKGKRQLVWSAGLRALLGLEDERSDGDIAADKPADAKHLGWVMFSDWMLVLRWGLRGHLLNLAAGGDWAVCADFLEGLRKRRFADRRARGLVVDLPEVAPPPRQLSLVLSVAGRSAELYG